MIYLNGIKYFIKSYFNYYYNCLKITRPIVFISVRNNIVFKCMKSLVSLKTKNALKMRNTE